MSLLSASELGAIRAVAESGMIETAAILTRSVIETDDGQESVWATSGLDVPCWVYEVTPVSKTLGALAGVVDLVEIFSIRVKAGTEVHSGDRVAVNGQIFDVQHTSDESTYEPWLDLACRKAVD